MLRLSAIIIMLCMVLIAGSVGAALYLLGGLRGADAIIVGIAVLTGLAVFNTVSNKLRDRSDLPGQIADLSRGSADLARQVAELNRRIAALEGQGDRIIDSATEKIRVATEPITAELAELGTLVKQLAETVSLHELKFATQLTAAREEAEAARAAAAVPKTDPDTAAAEARAAITQAVRDALDMSRIDLYLQPIVTLPQRKVRYYEALTRLRGGDGTLLAPADFLDAAEAGGLMPRIDQTLLLRSVQVVRRLQLKNRDIGLFCNIATSTLNDTQLFPEILQFMDANRALAPGLILEIKQSMLRAMGPLELESLAALREQGFRFCMDGVTDLRMEPRDLGERGIRYVKVPAQLLLSAAHAGNADIHAADLSDLLGRYGISLIAERIEAEAQVVDLLEYDVRFGQGFLFSQPRPVRAEALRGATQAETTAGAEEPRRVAAGGSSAAL